MREFGRVSAQRPAGGLRHAWARLTRWTRSRRLLSVWVFALVLISVIMLGNLPGAIRDRNNALLLQAHAQTLITDTVRVHVSYVSSRGGGHHSVDGVQATLPGSTDPVDLQAVGAVTHDIYDPIQEGWQTPSALTGYRPPLPVLVRRDANGDTVIAMAQQDYEYLVRNDVPQGETIVGSTCLVLAGVSYGLNRRWLRKRARRRETAQ